MMNRRDMLQRTGTAAVLACAPGIALGREAPATGTRPLAAILLDNQLAPQLGWPSLPPGTKALHFEGDVTQIWYRIIDSAWRRPGYVLGGITTANTLFLLEHLAHQQGRRVVSRAQLNDVWGASGAAIRWIIAPHHPSVMQ